MSKTAEELKDMLNDIERNVYDGIDSGGMFTEAYVLADELGESIDKFCEENAKLRELLSSYWKRTHSPVGPNVERDYLSEMRELGIEAGA